MRRRVSGLGTAAALLFAFACSGNRPAMFRVKGSVSFDGRAIESGEIIFAPLDKGAAPDAGRIENGTYDMLVKAGKKRVEIRASRPVGGGKPNPMGPIYHDYIPDKYNARTSLAADVTPDGENRFDYELKSGKR